MDTLPGLDVLGRGINVCGTLTPYQPPLLFDLGPDREVTTWNGQTYLCPERAVPDFNDRPASDYSFVSTTQQSFQSKLSVKVGLSGQYDGFSGQFTSYFSTSTKTDQSYYYAVFADCAQVWSVSLDPSVLDHIRPEVKAAIAEAVKTRQFGPLFDTWGTHFAGDAAVGGRAFLTTSTRKMDRTTETSVQVSVEAQYLAIAKATTTIDYSTVDHTFREESTTNCETVGGNPLLGQQIMTRPGALKEWQDSIIAFPSTIGFRPLRAEEGDDAYLVGIWNLAETQAGKNAVYEGFTAYLQRMTVPFYLAGGATGGPDTPYGDIRVGGVILYRNDWAALRLCVLDGLTLQVLLDRAYQTYDQPAQQAEMAGALSQYANKNVIVIVVSTDSGWPAGQLDGGLVRQLEHCGGSASVLGGGHSRREPYCLIGRPGKGGIDQCRPSGSPRAAIVGTLARTPDDPTYRVIASQVG